MFEKNGVDRGASHGGDVTGVACLILEDKIEDIMSEIEDILLDVSNEKEDKIKEVCGLYRIHFLLLSHIFLLHDHQEQICPTLLQKHLFYIS